MVYCGKPSAACERCRFRRLKCDQGVPSCSPCMRAQVDCPGYRDPQALTFRDQSEQVIRKSRYPARKKQMVLAATVDPDRPKDLKDSPPQESLAYPPQELAKAYLFVNYIAECPRGGHMSYLLNIVQDTRNSAVIAAMSAVGLAALSSLHVSPQFMLKARSQYVIALSQTNRALHDPAMSKRDEILAAVVLLGMFEVMIYSDDSFIERWMKHINGAAKLIEIRGPEQLTRQAGLDLFTYLRAQICISGIYQQRYIPPILLQLTEEAKQYRDPTNQFVDQLGTLVIQLSNLCAALKDKTITRPNEIVRTALRLDADLMSVLVAISPSWSYSTAKLPITDREPITRAVWGDSYHIYSSIAASNMWNNYRSARILVHEIVIDTIQTIAVATLDDPGSQQCTLLNQSRQIVRQLVEDICASVPFHLGLCENNKRRKAAAPNRAMDVSSTSKVNNMSVPFLNTLKPTGRPGERLAPSNKNNPYGSYGLQKPDAENRELEPQVQALSSSTFQISGAGGVTLVWPLLIAANSGMASSDLRKWIINRLDTIGHSLGFNQALAAARLLRDGMHSRAW